MTSLITGDLHLDNQKKNAYRWEILPWLEKQALHREVEVILIAGDLMDIKDRHPGEVVNRLVEFFYTSACQWVILPGNHDMFAQGRPFFGFLDNLDNVIYVSGPRRLKLPIDADETYCLLLPATPNWETEWPPHVERWHHRYIFMHGTFEGALSENGFPLPGIPRDFFPKKSYEQIYAGDIHTPAKVTDKITQIGSPYTVHFGDTYEPRVIYIGREHVKNLYPDILRRWVLDVRSLDDLDDHEEVEKGDQVKLRFHLIRSALPGWPALRKEAREEAMARGWDIQGIELAPLLQPRQRLGKAVAGKVISHADRVRSFAQKRQLDTSMVDYGLRLLAG